MVFPMSTYESAIFYYSALVCVVIFYENYVVSDRNFSLRKWIIENIPNTAFILQGHQHNRWQGKIEGEGVSIPVYQNPFGYVTGNETYAEPQWDPKLIVEVE